MYEKFELDAWWKPFETISRDTDLFYRDYFDKCLGIAVDEKIDSIQKVEMLFDKVKK